MNDKIHKYEEWEPCLDERERIAASTGPGSVIEDQPFIETWEAYGKVFWRCLETNRTIGYLHNKDLYTVHKGLSTIRHKGLSITSKPDLEWAFRWMIGEEEDLKHERSGFFHYD